MIFSGHMAFSLVTLGASVVVFAILRKIHQFKKRPSLRCKIGFFLRGLWDSFMLSFAKVARNKKDIISQLPDDILISIISRIPVKSAIRTSVLSRRWRNLHKFVSKFVLDSCFAQHDSVDGDEPHDSNFNVDSFNRFLKVRSGSKLSSLHLVCCLDESVNDRFERCIYSLGRLGVEDINLQCNCSGPVSDTGFSFSSRLLSEMPSLKVFELSSCYLRPGLRSHCNSLQELSLSYVTIFPGALDCILSNCLRLRSFSLLYCKCPPKLSFCGPHLNLKSLQIDVCEGVEEIELYASNLVKFEFWNHQMVNLIFKHVPQLEHVRFCIYEKDIVPYVFGKLAQDLPHLKSLNLIFHNTGDSFQVSSWRTRINMLFSNVQRLDITFDAIPKMDLLLLAPFLQSFPLLQEFYLHVITSIYYPPQQNEQTLFFHSELKKMEISGFTGTENEIKFALYILKSATSLELMRVSRSFNIYEGFGKWRRLFPTPWSEKEHKMIRRKLQGQAISKNAQIIIQHAAPIEDDS